MSGSDAAGSMELDLDRLVAVVATGSVRFLRVRVGGTEFVYSAAGAAAGAAAGGARADGGAQVVAARPAPAPPAPSPAPDPPATGPQAGVGADARVVAPMAGIFHHTSAPGAAPYVVAGQRVEPATTVGLMESMKVFTTVEAGIAGVVTAVLVPSGQAVAKGEPLVRIRPGDSTGPGGQR